MNIDTPKKEALELAINTFGAGSEVSPADVKRVLISAGFEPRAYNWIFNSDNKVGRGIYRLPSLPGNQTVNPQPANPVDATVNMAADVVPFNPPTPKQAPQPVQKFQPNATSEFEYATIPAKSDFYVPFGDFKDVDRVIRSQQFFPIFIEGMSGNGKTFMVEQICARAKRKMVRVQLSRETDEDDLIGGFRLIEGETKFMKGPVLRAMELGAVLLMDETDRCDPTKLMCLQGILEGKPYYVKKTGEVVYPQPGFNIVATANTKGKGSEDGRYVAASVLDDALLERFAITIEQTFPNPAIEKKILEKNLCYDRNCDQDDHDFVQHLIAWAEATRKTFTEVAELDECISTRRLVHIINAYKMFQNRTKAIKYCINRFDSETKNSFMELYNKFDPKVADQNATPSETDEPVGGSDPIPF